MNFDFAVLLFHGVRLYANTLIGMGKKRKASSRHNDGPASPNMDVGPSRKRIRDFEDVADSDDEFHLNRDKVLLDEEPETKRRRKWQEQEEFLEPSDEEVLDYSEEEVDEEDDIHSPSRAANGVASDSEASDDGAAEDEDDEETGWGMSRGEIYGADEIETEEQALEEEAEALRLQKKQLQSMTAADYGFDESEWQDGGVAKDGDKHESNNVVTEILPQLQINQDMSSAERLKLLKTRYPEFEPLSKELLSLRDAHTMLDQEYKIKIGHASSHQYPNLVTKIRAAAAYAGVLAMYFALLTSPANDGTQDVVAMPPTQLRDHPVMDSLVKCRELWMRAESLPEDLLPKTSNKVNQELTNGHRVEKETQRQPQRKQNRPTQKSRAERHAEAANAEAEKRKAERLQKTEAGLAELDALIAPMKSKRSKKSSRNVAKSTDSDFDEEAALTAHEAAEKAKRKKSLRFYTSQIAQKVNKRGVAGRSAGGDDDIPYRERLKDRQARLNAQAERKGQRNAAGADLGGESDEEDGRQARQVQGEQDNDYYDLIASRTARKKADKAALAEVQRQAALQGGQVMQEAVVGPDGKRKITYAIEKNKGLTPHRKKEVRNPRVKKRKKFDEKKKKLGSIKPVYKGGEGRGGYGGELTGIKKGLVKSTKL